MTRRHIIDERAAFGAIHGFRANQIAITTMVSVISAQTAGAARFELPLRGESLAAWSNRISYLEPAWPPG
jgi:hypothetical protein